MPNGWTEERRARQRALIQSWKPWAQSTGPKTKSGKSRSANNARKHGTRSRRMIAERRHLAELFRKTDLVSQQLFGCAKRLRRENEKGSNSSQSLSSRARRVSPTEQLGSAEKNSDELKRRTGLAESRLNSETCVAAGFAP